MYKVQTTESVSTALCTVTFREVPLIPIHFILMDVIGKLEFSAKGHQFVLTVIDMLMNYTWCVPLYYKENDKVVQTFLANIYF